MVSVLLGVAFSRNLVGYSVAGIGCIRSSKDRVYRDLAGLMCSRVRVYQKLVIRNSRCKV